MKFDKELTIAMNLARAKRLEDKGISKGVKNSNIVRKCKRNARNAEKQSV